MKRLLAVVLALVLLLTGVSSLALTSSEKENMFNSAFSELEAYLESDGNDPEDLDRIIDIFAELSNYSVSQSLRFYVLALQKVERDEYDFQLEVYMDGIEANSRFVDFLAGLSDSPVFTFEEFKFYVEGRKAEYEGRVSDAITAYKGCNGFYDSFTRKQNVSAGIVDELYSKGEELLFAGELEAAYSYFYQTAGYKDSDTYLYIILKRLGYTPEVQDINAIADSSTGENDDQAEKGRAAAEEEAARLEAEETARREAEEEAARIAAEDAARQAEEEAKRLAEEAEAEAERIAAEEQAAREAEAEAERLAAEEAAKKNQAFTVYAYGCNIRKEADANSDKLDYADVDQAFTAYEKVTASNGKEWYRIEYKDGEAYISANNAGLSKHSHVIVKDAAVAATCTSSGKTEGSHCSLCGAMIKSQSTISKLGHNSVKDAAVAATCTKAGKTEGAHCSRCGEVLTAQKTVEKLGHDSKTVAGKAATCTENGLTEGTQCKRCGKMITEQKEIAKLGHDPKTVAGKAATCTEKGLTEGTQCKRCGKMITAQKEITALGHNLTHVEAKNPTKSSVGWYAYDKCSRCSYTTYKERAKLKAGSWSEWSTTSVSESSTRDVETKVETEKLYKTVYKYNHYKYYNSSAGGWYFSYGSGMGNGSWESKTTDSPMPIRKYVDGQPQYSNDGGASIWYNETTAQVENGTKSVTYYRYRDYTE